MYQATVDDENLEHPMATMVALDTTHSGQRGTSCDMFQNVLADKAHLLPNAPLCSKAFGYIAQAATGKVFGKDSEEQEK